MIIFGERERTVKKSVVAYFKVVSKHLLGGVKENHEILQSV